MTIGIIRMIQFAATLVVAGPVALVGVFNVLEGRYALGIFFSRPRSASLGSASIYVRLTDRTVGRLRRLKNVRGGE